MFTYWVQHRHNGLIPHNEEWKRLTQTTKLNSSNVAECRRIALQLLCIYLDKSQVSKCKLYNFGCLVHLIWRNWIKRWTKIDPTSSSSRKIVKGITITRISIDIHGLPCLHIHEIIWQSKKWKCTDIFDHLIIDLCPGWILPLSKVWHFLIKFSLLENLFVVDL